MQAIALHEFGGPEVLVQVELPAPEPAPRDVVVRVQAVAVTRLDLFARAGNVPTVRLPHVLGGEHAGVVTAVGRDVDDLPLGTRVVAFPIYACGDCRYCRRGRAESCPVRQLTGLHRPGAYAEYACSRRENVRELPDDLSAVDAAALATSGALAWRQFREANVSEGDWLLVQAAGGALGALTAALGVHRGARVIATSRSHAKRTALCSLGVAAALDPSAPAFVDQVQELTDGAGVDVAIDNIGDADLFATTLAALGRTGVLVLSGAGQLVEARDEAERRSLRSPRVDLAQLYQLSQRIIGLSAADLASFHALWEDVEAGLRAPLDRTLPLERTAEAHRRMGATEHFGRLVLTP